MFRFRKRWPVHAVISNAGRHGFFVGTQTAPNWRRGYRQASALNAAGGTKCAAFRPMLAFDFASSARETTRR